jgi:Methyltransferase domain
MLSGQDAWSSLDALGIHGFGTHLLRFDFPPRAGLPSSWGYGRPPHPGVAAYLDSYQAACRKQTRTALCYAGELEDLPLRAEDKTPFAWLNLFQTPLDLAFGYGLLRSRPIQTYLEIGSGVSTHLADRARTHGARFSITCIDPEPRVEVAALADRVERRHMEDMIEEIVDLSGPGTALFFDGSHFAFPGSDVTRFFLDILPALRAGTLVHIHDIYLPDDYPPVHLGRLWNEQYLLAAWLLGGGARLRPVIPGHWIAGQIAKEGIEVWAPEAPAGFQEALRAQPDSSAWWMEVS